MQTVNWLDRPESIQNKRFVIIRAECLLRNESQSEQMFSDSASEQSVAFNFRVSPAYLARNDSIRTIQSLVVVLEKDGSC